MKSGGLALLLGKGPPPKGGGLMPDDESAEPMPDDGSDEGDGDAKRYADLAADAIVDGDKPGISEALMGLWRCK